ncbi:MAG: single-stranded DNA-binding protein [Oscillospiraceae bacterium]|nr:single-stranded DNA-binding protein [Oscillospiraceae bacterium]
MYSKLQDGSWIICGYVAKDATVRTTQNGKKYTTWSVAVSSVKGNDGQWKTNYTNCIAWDKAAEVAATIRKGDTVLCVGTMETNTGNDGKTYKNMVCSFISIMGKAGMPPQYAQNTQCGSSLSDLGSMDDFETILADGDVPF